MLLRFFAPFLAFLSLMFGFGNAAHAAIPPEITTALAELKTDTAAVALAILLVAFGIFALKYIAKAK